MCDDIDLQLGRRVRRRRRLLGLTQQQLGACCGVRFQQIQKYETATNKMSAGMIARLARALGVEVGYFYDGLDLSGGMKAAQPRGRAQGREILAGADVASVFLVGKAARVMR
ncbi:MAG: XRE family transcriptional regulator [Phenylobacterium sp.]|uniref:helix-turn-helix domain-containing protein n=1 Tax=Phenylobacterium sp. TaxID=1871053 RepID=UPI001200C321|nr:helix-turn-helix transcriptional regulator [Phenylobacterium sp.]TAJ69841.1 MAG: XRE family transcriptional regulator [Phenylobacterium sp.]